MKTSPVILVLALGALVFIGCSIGDVPVSGVTVNKSSTSMLVGGTEPLWAMVSPANATDQRLSWSSTDSEVATVGATGLVTAIGVGSATIEVTTEDGGFSASCEVTVAAAPIAVTGVSLNKSSTSILVGGTEQLAATVTPSDATDQNLTWSSNDQTVATVTSTGLVIAKTAGTAEIVVSAADGGFTASCVVTVSVVAIPVTGVSLNKSSTSILVGGTEQLAATVTPSDATDQNLTWSSNDQTVATVTSTGLVAAKAAGTAEILVTTADGGFAASCVVTVSVVAIPVTGVSLNKSSTSIEVGQTEQLTATIVPANATNQNLTWSSNDHTVATATSMGLVTAKAAGTAEIVVVTADGGFSAACTVTVSVQAGQWATATLIETDDAGDAGGAQVAVDGSGNAIAVWPQSDGTRGNIWANRYTAGTGWGAATLIETDDAGGASRPQIAFDGSGNAIAVWGQNDGTRYNIWANRYSNGWATAILIETDDAGDAWFPQIAFDDSGNAVAVWQQFDGTSDNIWANRYTAGSGWGTATLIETDDAGNAQYPQIAFDGSGNAIAVWQQVDGTRWNIWANRYTAGTGWGAATLIETDDAGGASRPQIAFDGSGNAIAVWGQNDGTRYNIWANRYTTWNGWGTATLIETDDAGNAWYPQIAFDGSGNAIAVWQQFDGTRDNIWANRYTAGSGWGTATLIETDDAGNAQYPQIAFDGSGNAIAVWEQHDGTRWNIWANPYTAWNGWGTAALIETDDAGDARGAQVAVDGSGNAIAVWLQYDGTRFSIWANRCE